ncbi:MAG: ABC transporter permease [Spirochaetae bacterium HGW-Spirochaetae-4]|nr:MAG: ABC transporter permease [Spirochaetae bacterium HGW-Spirochaetae-4]
MKVKPTTPYFYVLPGLFLVVMIVYIPVLSNLIYSFFRLSSYSAAMSFVGLKNYVALFTDPVLLIIIKNNVLYLMISLITQVGFGTLLAILLESSVSGKASGIYRNILFTPALMSLTAVGLLWQFIYTPKIGLLNSLLRLLGLDSLQHVWLGESGLAMLSIIGMSQWQFTGYITVLMVVAIQKIPDEYFEASRIAGANALQRVIYITIPSVKEQLLVCSIITMIGAFKVFTEVYVTTSGGPGNSTHVLGTYLYQQAFLYDDLGMAAAVGMILLLVTLAISLIQLKMARTGEV